MTRASNLPTVFRRGGFLPPGPSRQNRKENLASEGCHVMVDTKSPLHWDELYQEWQKADAPMNWGTDWSDIWNDMADANLM